jgi:hypothetical protein
MIMRGSENPDAGWHQRSTARRTVALFLFINDRNRIYVVSWVSELANSRSDLRLMPLRLCRVRFHFFSLKSLWQPRFRNCRIGLRLALDYHQCVSARLAPLTPQRRQNSVLLVKVSPTFDYCYPSMVGQRFRAQDGHRTARRFGRSIKGGDLGERGAGKLMRRAAGRDHTRDQEHARDGEGSDLIGRPARAA